MLFRALLVLLFFALLARAVWRLVAGIASGASADAGQMPRRPAPAAVKMAQCPGCGTYVVPDKAISEVSGGETRYFCSEACLARART